MAIEIKILDVWKNDASELTMVEKMRAKQTLTGVPTTEDMSGRKVAVTKVVTLKVHNDKLTDPDYTLMQITGYDPDTGEILELNTSSESFMSGMEEMLEDVEDKVSAVVIEVKAQPSKNFTGRSFYTPRIIDILP